jgi:DNA-binding MarR family transcriptional regulator
MSISKPRKSRGRRPAMPGGRRTGSRQAGLPVTVSAQALLVNGSDRRFRVLVYDLLTIAARMNAVREHFAQLMGLSGPQYSVLMAISQYQVHGRATVGALARLLHVSSAFIATETGKLVRVGLITKRPNPDDGRSVLLAVTPAGAALLQDNSSEIRKINDQFFGALDHPAFESLVATAATLVRSSSQVMGRLNHAHADAITVMREAAE